MSERSELQEILNRFDYGGDQYFDMEGALDALLAHRDEQIAALQAQLDGVRALHTGKSGINARNEHYVICDYDKTDWPCRSFLILADAPADVLAARDARVAAEALEEAAHQGWVAEGTRSALRARAAVIRAGVSK